MTRGGRRSSLWLGWSLIVAMTAGCVVLVFSLRDQEQDSFNALFGTFLAVATAAVGAATWWWRRARPTKATSLPSLPLRDAANELADQLERQWKPAAAEQGLTSSPIPVQWKWSRRQVTGPIANVVEERGGRRFAPLPNMAAVTEKQLCSGTLHDLLGVYGGLNSGRLVVLGELGAGKSAAGILLLLDALAHRATIKAEDREQVPVPVLVSAHGWDPINENFSEWLADRLKRDYALLRAPEYGRDAALQLIKGGRLAVILDGWDEMPEALRAVALSAMDKQATFRLVVLTRSEELVAAVSNGGRLRDAAALELLPIDSQQAAKYLTSCQINPLPPPWQHLINHLHDHTDGILAQALSTPLMLALIRDTYGSGEWIHEPIDVDELLDANNCRFDSREAIENYLLDRLLTAAYARELGKSAPPYTANQARRWLGQLACRMKKDRSRDLAWWQIPRWVPTWPRAFATVVVMSIVSVFLVGPLAGLAAHMHLLSTFQVGPLAAFGAFCGKALGLGFMFGLGLLLMSPPGGGSPQRDRMRWRRTDILVVFFLALGVGGGVGLERGLVGGLEYGLAGALMSSFVVGLGFILGGGPPQQLGWLRWSKTDTRTNLLTGLVVGLVTGLVTGLGYGLVYGPKYGLAPGFIVGIAYMCLIVLGGQSPSQRNQSLWSMTDVSTTVLIGLTIAIASSASYGIIYVLIVILGGRSPLQRSRPLWSRTTTPAILLTGLMAGLVFGLVFGLTHGLGFGLKPGLVIGPVFGLTVGLLLGLRQASTEAASPLDPRSLWRQDRRFGLRLGLGLGLVIGLTGGLADGLVFGPGAGLVFGFTGGLVAGLGTGLMSSATWETALANAQLQRRGEAPVRLLRFLDDARERQILRTVGPRYQFRDARLQNRLAGACETVPQGRSKIMV